MDGERDFRTSVEGVIEDGQRRGKVPEDSGRLACAYVWLVMALLISVVLSIIALEY